MLSVFNLNNSDAERGDNEPPSVDIDELYEAKRQKDLRKQTMYNRILKRVHLKIKNTSKITKDTYCWVNIPEVILGLQGYNNAECIAFITNSLRANKFDVTYYHPNTLFISWSRWIPGYVRDEIRLKTGISVDELGQPIKTSVAVEEEELDMYAPPSDESSAKKKKQYTPVSNYRATGKLIYGDDVMNNHLTK